MGFCNSKTFVDLAVTFMQPESSTPSATVILEVFTAC